VPAIDPSFLTTGPDFAIGGAADPSLGIDPEGLEGLEGLEGAEGVSGGGGESFGSVLGRQLEALSQTQTEAADASAALAAGTASNPEEVVMAVERARLSMQLASQLRTKGVEAVNEIFRSQV
jgi:flagellar hook-basal body complex protein FliE